MVGIVIVSHSQALAEGVRELAEMMAREVKIACAGGLEEGLSGVSYERVMNAVEEVCGRDGAVIFGDMGSAMLTSELVLEEMKDDRLFLVNAPLVEGVVRAAVLASGGADVDTIVKRVEAEWKRQGGDCHSIS
ncbi:MAG: PTS-dependent dihydroxyacetone kinase phosphotransferase subunit DhaM [Selenomonas ruminantium]|nr:PTS-dependent dihydroxyacetone kinase phosphotransferase subunit DhaM [Selenomonas ruminantium]